MFSCNFLRKLFVEVVAVNIKRYEDGVCITYRITSIWLNFVAGYYKVMLYKNAIL